MDFMFIQWTLILSASFFSIINLVLFVRLLKKHDDLQLKIYTYLQEVGTERLQIERSIAMLSKDIKQLKIRYENEIKSKK